MNEARSKVLKLLASGMSPDDAVDIIIDVVARALYQRNGRPGTTQAHRAPVAALVDDDVSQGVTSNLSLTRAPTADRGGANGSMSGSDSGSSLALFSEPSKTFSLRDRRSNEPLPPGFADFYAMYPRKKSRVDAIRAWTKQKPPLDAVMIALVWHIEEWDQEGRPIDKVPYPASWLNGRCWEDERKPRRSVAPVVSQKSRTQLENLMGIAQRGANRDGK